MDFEMLENFLVVSEYGNMSRAAEYLHISQPSLSRQIAILEGELDMALFIRRPTLELTEAGILFKEHAISLLNDYHQMKEEMKDLKFAKQHTVTIAYLNLSQRDILIHIREYLQSIESDFNVIMKRLSLKGIEDAVKNKEVDLGFDMVLDFDKLQDIEHVLISESGLYAVVPKSNPLFNRKELRLKDLEGQKIIQYNRSVAPQLFDSILEQFIAEDVTIELDANYQEMESILMATTIGQGIALMDSTAKVMETDYVNFIPIWDSKYKYNWYLIWNKNIDNPYIEELRKIILNFVNDG